METKELDLGLGLMNDIQLSRSYIGELEKATITLMMYPFYKDNEHDYKFEPYVLLRCYTESSEDRRNLDWIIKKAIEKRLEEINEENGQRATSRIINYKFKVIIDAQSRANVNHSGAKSNLIPFEFNSAPPSSEDAQKSTKMQGGEK